MTCELIYAAIGEYTDGETVRRVGVSDQEFVDPAVAAQLDGGVFLKCMDESQPFRWSERIRHQPQGGSATIEISELNLINTEGLFDEWTRYSVAGLSWVVKVGRADQSWEEFETVAVAVATGAPEFRGRTRMTIRLRTIFAALSQPVSQEVFDENTPNEQLINRRVQKVFGDIFQARAVITDPFFQSVHCASNLAVIRSVAQGGTPTTGWVDIEDGYKIIQGSVDNQLPFTADFAGPPKPETELVDVFAEIGGLSTWASGEPEGIIVESEPPDSSFLEDATNGGGLITTTQVAGTDSDDLNCSSVSTSGGNAFLSVTAEDAGGSPVTNQAAWPALINANDAAHIAVNVNGQFLVSQRLTLKGFGGALADGKNVTGVEVDVRAQKTGAGAAETEFFEVRLVLPNGAVTENKAAETEVTGTSTVYPFGGAADSWGSFLTPDIINSDEFGLRLAFRVFNGTLPITVKVFEVILTVHHNDGSKVVRLYADTAAKPELALEVGGRYRQRITFDAATPGDAVSVRVAGVDAAGDPVKSFVRVPGSTASLNESANLDDPNVQTEVVLDDSGEAELEFIADGPVWANEYFPVTGQSGEQRIVRIVLEQISISVNKFVGLARYIVEEAGFDPDEVMDLDSFEAIATATGDPVLGWLVRNQTTPDQLLTHFAHSLASTVWGGLDGKLHAAMLSLPEQPESGEFLMLGEDDAAGDMESVTEDAPELRDRVHAAQNIDPLRENETAGITDTWDEAERQKRLADWRITERADFETIQAGTAWPLLPVPNITGVSPPGGAPAGGDTITISGTGFLADSLTVSFGGVSATSITLVDSGTITCVNPRNYTGAAFDPAETDSTLTLSNNDLTIANGFGNSRAEAGKSTIPKTTGKHYAEFVIDAMDGSEDAGVGLAASTFDETANWIGNTADTWAFWDSGYYTGGVLDASNTFVEGDTIMVAYDADAGKVWFGKNGTWDGDPEAGTGEQYSGLSGTMHLAATPYDNGVQITMQNKSQLYAPPAGFQAWGEDQAGAVDVVVTHAGGSNTESSGFEYVDPPEWVTADQKVVSGDGAAGPHSIDAPDNLSAGDLIVFVVSAPNENFNLEAGTPPAGMTYVGGASNGTITSGFDPIIQVYSKVSDGTETSFTFDEGGSENRFVAVCGRVINADTVGDFQADYLSFGTDLASPAATVAAAPALLLCGSALRTSRAPVVPSGMTEVYSDTPGSFESLGLAVEVVLPNGATDEKTWDSGGNAEQVAFSLILEQSS